MPTDSPEVDKLAVPPERVPLPMLLPPSLNVTVPPGVPAAGPTADTVAVKVTDWPNTDAFGELLTDVELLPLLTVCVMAAEALVLKLASPP